MFFPNRIIGPKFSDGDITTFIFHGSQLTLRLPRVPKNKNSIDDVTRYSDFRSISTSDWDLNDQSQPCIQLATQLWCYEDARSLDNIAECALYVSLIEAPAQHVEQNTLLEQKGFDELMLAWLDHSFRGNIRPDDVADESKSGRYNLSAIERTHLNWLGALIRFVPEGAPSSACLIPIDNRFVLMVSLEIQSLHYAGRSNPYSEETLKQFEKDLFDDFLNHIKIEYSPETIALINALNNKTPA